MIKVGVIGGTGYTCLPSAQAGGCWASVSAGAAPAGEPGNKVVDFSVL